ncbi:hypothetical protein HA075_26040 [bacterium BFN5]|nr:hypothetical protein HA075_26040 [bacterium BFN5]
MKDYIRKRVLDICNHILDSKDTVRQAAAVFGVSKSTVHTSTMSAFRFSPAKLSALSGSLAVAKV